MQDFQCGMIVNKGCGLILSLQQKEQEKHGLYESTLVLNMIFFLKCLLARRIL
jgi:hypothetical protein